jgi:hypothetical protein
LSAVSTVSRNGVVGVVGGGRWWWDGGHEGEKRLSVLIEHLDVKVHVPLPMRVRISLREIEESQSR